LQTQHPNGAVIFAPKPIGRVKKRIPFLPKKSVQVCAPTVPIDNNNAGGGEQQAAIGQHIPVPPQNGNAPAPIIVHQAPAQNVPGQQENIPVPEAVPQAAADPNIPGQDENVAVPAATPGDVAAIQSSSQPPNEVFVAAPSVSGGSATSTGADSQAQGSGTQGLNGAAIPPGKEVETGGTGSDQPNNPSPVIRQISTIPGLIVR